MYKLFKKIIERFKTLKNQVGREQGFSLVEIMIVVVIITILIGLVATGIFTKPDKAKVAAAKVKITQFGMPLLDYYQQKGTFPGTEEGLQSLVAEKLIREKDLLDPWGNPYQYRYPGENDMGQYEIWSYGVDGKEGGTGLNEDIKSWEIN